MVRHAIIQPCIHATMLFSGENGARTGTRTPTPVTVLDPKSSASANSAILAGILLLNSAPFGNF